MISAQVLQELKLHLSLMGLKNFEENQPSPTKVDRFRLNAWKSPKKAREPILRSTQEYKTMLRGSIIECDNNNNRGKLHRSDCLFDKRHLTMDEFLNLKRQRDMECTKMNQSSKVLKILNESERYGMWEEKLLAEKLLLESSTTVDILVKKIREDAQFVIEPAGFKADLHVKNLIFKIGTPRTNPKETEFFLVLLTNGYEVKTSRIERATNGTITFRDQFTFQVKATSKVSVQVYSIIMKNPSKIYSFATNILKKSKCYTTTKYQYENLLTSDLEDKFMLNSSFKLCGETEIDISKLDQNKYVLHLIPGSSLDDRAFMETSIKNVSLEVERCGFLTLGNFVKNSVEWNCKWCVLKSKHLKIYNSPNDEEPILSIDISDCLAPINIAPRDCCSRTKCLVIEVRRGEIKGRYFLRADNYKELYMWKYDLNNVAQLIANWKSILN